MTVYEHEQAYNIVMDEMMEGRKYMNVDSYIAKQIVRALLDAGLLSSRVRRLTYEEMLVLIEREQRNEVEDQPDHRHRHEVPDEDVWRGDR